jgi:hypothetical protein
LGIFWYDSQPYKRHSRVDGADSWREDWQRPYLSAITDNFVLLQRVVSLLEKQCKVVVLAAQINPSFRVYQDRPEQPVALYRTADSQNSLHESPWELQLNISNHDISEDDFCQLKALRQTTLWTFDIAAATWTDIDVLGILEDLLITGEKSAIKKHEAFMGVPAEVILMIAARCRATSVANLRQTSKAILQLTKRSFKNIFREVAFEVNFRVSQERTRAFFTQESTRHLAAEVEILRLMFPPPCEGEWPREIECVFQDTSTTIRTALEARTRLCTVVIENMGSTTTHFHQDRAVCLAIILYIMSSLNKDKKIRVELRNVPYKGLAVICQIVATAKRSANPMRYLEQLSEIRWISWESQDPIDGSNLMVDALSMPLYDDSQLQMSRHLLSGIRDLKQLTIDTFPGLLTASNVADLLTHNINVPTITVDGTSFSRAEFVSMHVPTLTPSISIEQWSCDTVAFISPRSFINRYKRRSDVLYLLESGTMYGSLNVQDLPKPITVVGGDVLKEVCRIAWNREHHESTIAKGQDIWRTAKKFSYCQEKSGFVFIVYARKDSVFRAWISLRNFYDVFYTTNAALALIAIIRDSLYDWELPLRLA